MLLVAAACLWGLFWIPLRHFEKVGLGNVWASDAMFLAPVALMLPVALWRLAHGRPAGFGTWKTAIFTGGAFALYAGALVFTDISHALILFYLAPVWSTIIEMVVMKRALTAPRALAIALGLAGITALLGGRGGWPVPHNIGDWMAITSGIFWAIGSTRVRLTPAVSEFEQVFSFFFYAAMFGLIIALAPLPQNGPLPAIATITPLLPGLLAVAAVFIIPATFMQMYAVKRIDPARACILFQTEAITGITSAALFTSEPFGWPVALGTALIIAASLTEIMKRD